MKFEESDLIFEFDDNWKVVRFDKHRFYRYLCAVGLKAVDFIGIYNDELLVLMEVKNYNKRKASPVEPNIRGLTGENARLINDFSLKLSDSILAIDTIYKYFKRKLLHNIFTFLWEKFPFRIFKNTEHYFWFRCHELLHTAKKAQLVLWLETADHYPGLTEREIQQLKEKLLTNTRHDFADLNVTVFIAGEGFNPYDGCLNVRAK